MMMIAPLLVMQFLASITSVSKACDEIGSWMHMKMALQGEGEGGREKLLFGF